MPVPSPWISLLPLGRYHSLSAAQHHRHGTLSVLLAKICFALPRALRGSRQISRHAGSGLLEAPKSASKRQYSLPVQDISHKIRDHMLLYGTIAANPFAFRRSLLLTACWRGMSGETSILAVNIFISSS